MKKFISLALVAMVAMVATMTVVSCGSDDDNTPSTFTLTGKMDSSSTTIEVTGAVMKYFQNVVGSDASVLTSSNSTFTISGSYDKKDAVIAKIKAADQSALDTALDNLFCIMSTAVNIYDGSDLVRGMSYTIPGEKLFKGTFTSTINDVTYQLVIGDKVDDYNLSAKVTIGKDTYEGTLTAIGMTATFNFISNEKYNDQAIVVITSKGDILDSFSSDLSSFNADVIVKDETVGTSVVFTRQK